MDQWLIQDYPDGQGSNPWVWGKNLFFGKVFAENCMKMKESLAPLWIRQCGRCRPLEWQLNNEVRTAKQQKIVSISCASCGVVWLCCNKQPHIHTYMYMYNKHHCLLWRLLWARGWKVTRNGTGNGTLRQIGVNPPSVLWPVADPGFSPGGGRQLPKVLLFFNFFPKTAWKWKNLDPQGGRASLAPPLDLPMVTVNKVGIRVPILTNCLVPVSYWQLVLPLQTKLQEGNVFTPVCQSFCSRKGVCGERGVG